MALNDTVEFYKLPSQIVAALAAMRPVFATMLAKEIQEGKAILDRDTQAEVVRLVAGLIDNTNDLRDTLKEDRRHLDAMRNKFKALADVMKKPVELFEE